MRSRLARLTALAGAVALASWPLTAGAAPTMAPGGASATGWSASASADGVRVGVFINEFIAVSNVVDAGGPVAQASTSDLLGSLGLAAYPYPGDVVLTAHGLSMGKAPNYPLIAQSNNSTQPDSAVSQGPYQLHAHSSDDSSTALAEAAAGGGGAAAGTTRSTAAAVHDAKTGVVTADAESTIEGFSVAGVLRIGRLHSFAQMTSAPGAKPTPTSDTEIGDVTVAGQQVGVTDKGLVLAGTNTPLPSDSTANAALTAAGVTVHYLAGVVSGSSVVAPGLSVAVAQNVPGVGETTVTYLLGQASASAQSPGPAGAATGLGGSVATPPTDTGAPGATSGSSGSGLPAATGSTAAVTAPAGTAPQTAPAPVPPAAGPTVAYRLTAVHGPSSESLYVVVAAAAIVMVAAAQLFRVLAVRLAWT